MAKVGFIGTGVMGQSIVRHLLASGYLVSVYNRTKEKAETLLNEGAVWQETPEEIVNQSEIIFTMVGFPTDVEAVYYGEHGIFSGNCTGKIFVDLTTSTPSLAEKIAKTALEKSATALDIPVSGGDIGAQNGTLTLMAGGDEKTFEALLPLLKQFSKTQIWHGAAGCGQHAKMANQIMVAATMVGMTEVLVYSKAAGLSLEKVIETLSGGAAGNWSLANYGPRILQGDYSPGFFVKHFVKDLRIVLEESEKMNLLLPGTKLAKELYEELSAKGYENAGTQSLIKLWWT